jgi:GcrA cell cycle regulator
MSWTEERVELLKKLWSEGLSASRIAAQLGGVTRNAVIGKVHRLRLLGRGKSLSLSAGAAREASSTSHMVRMPQASIRGGNTALAHVYDHDAELTPKQIENVIPIRQWCSLLELTEQNCHWPIGDPGSGDFLFCGGNSVPGLPYCAYHRRIAYRPPGRRRELHPLR